MQISFRNIKNNYGLRRFRRRSHYINRGFRCFGKIFDKAFHIKGIIPNNEAVVAIAQQTLGTETALIMVFGMIANLLIARFTRFKYVFLTGHHTLFMACLISAVFSTTGIKGASLVISGSIILGLLMVIFSALFNRIC